MSKTEDVARRFERRNGFELIDYAPVALPLFRLTVDAVTMIHREIAPIKEFIMRSLKTGLAHPEDIAGFLGLDSTTVSATVDQLMSDRYASGAEDGTINLTDRGLEVLAKARELSPRDEMLVFLYDRLLRKPVRLAPDQVLAPVFVDPQRVIEFDLIRRKDRMLESYRCPTSRSCWTSKRAAAQLSAVTSFASSGSCAESDFSARP